MKREEKSKQSQEKIIQAAFSLFTSKGYDATTTQDIIDLAGLSRGALYHHFKSKENILESVLDGIVLETNRFLEELVANDQLSTKEKMVKIVEHTTTDPTRQKLARLNWVEKIPFALLDEVRYTSNVITPYVTEIIKQGMRNGEYTIDYPEELTELIIFFFDIILNPVIIKRDHEALSSRFDFLVFLLNKLDIPIIDDTVAEKMKELFK